MRDHLEAPDNFPDTGGRDIDIVFTLFSYYNSTIMGQEIISKIDHLRKILVSYCTKGDYAYQDQDYINIRRELMINLQLKGYVPEFVRNCRDLGELWEFIKTKFPHYYQRRSFIQEEFNPLYRVAEEKLLLESHGSASNYILLTTVESSQVQAAWRKVI